MLWQKQKIITLGKYLVIIILPLILFLSIQTASQTLLCPDSFYHAKMADFLAKGQLIQNFTWLPYTIFSHSYINHHFLYHLFLIPFVKLFDPLAGIKIATAIFATLAVFVFYWFLKKFKIKFPIFWTFLLLTSSVFLTRINLAKVPAAALPLLFLSLYALFKKKLVLLSILAFAYVWFYNTWPILVVLIFVYCFANAIKKTTDQSNLFKKNRTKIINFIKFIFSQENLILVFWCLLGITGGLVLNPYFPENIYFNWVHIVKIGLRNYQNILPVGVEWYPYNPITLIFDNLLIVLPWIIGLGWFFISLKKRGEEKIFGQSLKSICLILFSSLFFVYTIKSRRNIDYFIPLAILSAAFSFNNLLTYLPWKQYWQELKVFKKNIHYILISALLTFLLITILIFSSTAIFKNIWLSKKNEFSKGVNFNQYKNVSQFLKENTDRNEIIFHSSWDEFPALFYHNDYNYYLAGLDPTFSYEENKPLYWLWYNIITGQQTKDIALTIKNIFQANLVFIKKSYSKMKETIDQDQSFELIYQDNDGYVYQIKNL